MKYKNLIFFLGIFLFIVVISGCISSNNNNDTQTYTSSSTVSGASTIQTTSRQTVEYIGVPASVNYMIGIYYDNERLYAFEVSKNKFIYEVEHFENYFKACSDEKYVVTNGNIIRYGFQPRKTINTNPSFVIQIGTTLYYGIVLDDDYTIAFPFGPTTRVAPSDKLDAYKTVLPLYMVNDNVLVPVGRVGVLITFTPYTDRVYQVPTVFLNSVSYTDSSITGSKLIVPGMKNFTSLSFDAGDDVTITKKESAVLFTDQAVVFDYIQSSYINGNKKFFYFYNFIVPKWYSLTFEFITRNGVSSFVLRINASETFYSGIYPIVPASIVDELGNYRYAGWYVFNTHYVTSSWSGRLYYTVYNGETYNTFFVW